MPIDPIEATWPLKKPQQLVYVELGPHNGGMMLGICELGLKFRAVAPLHETGPLPFSFALDGKSRLQGVGEIAWTEDDGKTGGLKFTSISSEFCSALRAWLAGESSPKDIGREFTPAAALPFDSIEKIKSSIREGHIDEIKAAAPARHVDEKPPQTKPPRATPAEARHLETEQGESEAVPAKPVEPVSPLPKFHLPSASVPGAAPNAFALQPEQLPAPVAMAYPTLDVPFEAQKEYAPLPGLHQPFAHVPPEAEETEDSPRLSRAAAAGIIALALAVILVALVLSFRREVGETLIHLGEKLAGEQRTAATSSRSESDSSIAAAKPAAVSTPANSASSQAHAAETLNGKQVEVPKANSALPGTASGTSAQPERIQHVEDLPMPTDGGSGQKEFEQARNILRGNRRQRDLPVAVNLLWAGVRKGYIPAEVTLADLYARGDGVEQSCEQARILLKAAVQKGSPEGRRRLDQLRRQGCPSN